MNRRPQRPERCALPTALHPEMNFQSSLNRRPQRPYAKALPTALHPETRLAWSFLLLRKSRPNCVASDKKAGFLFTRPFWSFLLLRKSRPNCVASDKKASFLITRFGSPFRIAKSPSILVARMKISKLIFIARSLVWSGLGDLNS